MIGAKISLQKLCPVVIKFIALFRREKVESIPISLQNQNKSMCVCSAKLPTRPFRSVEYGLTQNCRSSNKNRSTNNYKTVYTTLGV